MATLVQTGAPTEAFLAADCARVSARQLECSLQSGAAMLLERLGLTVVTASLLLGCSKPDKPPRPPAPPTPAEASYKLITPNVSTNAPKQPTAPVPVDENEDIMASILAIPPGR